MSDEPQDDEPQVDWLERWRKAETREFPWEDRPQEKILFGSVDALGRKIPRRLGIADYLLTIARSEPARVRRVPLSAVAEEIEDESGLTVAYVDCPCGTHPVVSPELGKCPGCERYYVLFEGGSVFVTYGEMAAPPLQPDHVVN